MRIPSTNETQPSIHPISCKPTKVPLAQHIHVAHGASSYLVAPSPPSPAITCVVQPNHQFLLPLSRALCGTNCSARLFTTRRKRARQRSRERREEGLNGRTAINRYPIPIIRISHRIVPTRHETRLVYSFCLLGNKVQCVAHQSLVD